MTQSGSRDAEYYRENPAWHDIHELTKLDTYGSWWLPGIKVDALIRSEPMIP